MNPAFSWLFTVQGGQFVCLGAILGYVSSSIIRSIGVMTNLGNSSSRTLSTTSFLAPWPISRDLSWLESLHGRPFITLRKVIGTFGFGSAIRYMVKDPALILVTPDCVSKSSQGSKVRVQPDGVVFQSPNAYRNIYNTRANVRRSDSYAAFRRNKNGVNTLNATDPAVHQRKRRILNLAFHEKSVRAAGSFINRHVDRWNELLTDGDGTTWSVPKNLSDLSDYLIFDILGDLCFGRPFGTKEPGDNPFKGIPHATHSYLKFQYPVNPTKSYRLSC